MKKFLMAVLLGVLSIGTPQTAKSKPKPELINQELIAQFEQTVQQNIATPEFTTSLSTATLDNGGIKEYDNPEPEHLTREEYLLSFEEEQCPDPFEETDWSVKNRHKDIDSTYYHGNFCTFGNNVLEGRIRKHEMEHNDPERRGICTCSATACENGYKLENGVCEPIIADENGNCVRKEIPLQPGVNDALDLCKRQCKEYADKNKCTNGKAAVYKNNTNFITKNACVCNETQESIDAIHTYNANIQFNSAVQKLANISFKKVCNTLWKKRDHDHDLCVDKVFNNINVQKIHGVALAKEYLVYHHKFKYELIECDKDARYSDNNQDYISCSAVSSSGIAYYYEFEFDDLTESFDSDLHEDLRIGLCESVFKRSFDGRTCNPIGLHNTNEFIAAAKRVGIFARKGNGNSVHLTNGISKKDYTTNKGNNWTKGFDPRVFYNKQLQASSSLEHILYEHILQLVDANASAIRDEAVAAKKAGLTCKAGYVTYTGKIDGQDTDGNGDDVLTCTLTLLDESTKLDFVFDDLSEFSDTLSKAAYEQIACDSIGGTSTDTMCLGVTEEMCNRIAKLEPSTSPKWDKATQSCKLEGAADKQKLTAVMDLTIVLAGVIITAAVVLATGGSALIAISAIGGSIIEYKTSSNIQDKMTLFFQASNKCRTSEQNCAKKILEKYMEPMWHFLGNASEENAKAIDKELARLAQLLPSNDSFFTDMKQELENEGWLESMEVDQIGLAIGRVLQIASLAGAIKQLFVKGMPKLPILLRCIKQKLSTTKGSVHFVSSLGSDAYSTVSQVKNITASTAVVLTAVSMLDYRKRASRHFDKHLDYFKEHGKNKVLLPKKRLNDAEWAELNLSLQQYNQVHLIDTEYNGELYMKFEKYTPSQT